MTLVERTTGCITAHAVVWERTEETLRQMVWQRSCSAERYFSDGFALYETIGYPGPTGEYHCLQDKSETYRVEGDTAELRHYLARLGRRSRCFSRCPLALSRAVDLFVYAWNRRQRWNRDNPKYPQPVLYFVTSC
jgi:insertion element IS1 protein InsB